MMKLVRFTWVGISTPSQSPCTGIGGISNDVRRDEQRLGSTNKTRVHKKPSPSLRCNKYMRLQILGVPAAAAAEMTLSAAMAVAGARG